MRTCNEAETYSQKNPTELVEFKDWYFNRRSHLTGFFLNGEREGLFELFSDKKLKYTSVFNVKTRHSEHKRLVPAGTVDKHYFRKGVATHGEFVEFNTDGTVGIHRFYNAGKHVEELDYLVHEDRDEAFYVTLALYGIDKDCTF